MSKLKYANGNQPLTEKEKELIIRDAAEKYGMFLTSLGFDWKNDPNSSDTPMRVAKAFVNDLAKGVYSNPPRITVFDNVDKYDGMVFQGNIKLHSLCSHHHLPFTGCAHVAYIPSIEGKVIGLSKLNRIVEFYARRPQVQENLTMQIHEHIDTVCERNEGVAVMLEANHMCTCIRGVKHDGVMKTSKLSGAFRDSAELARTEFYDFIKELK
jgi:GTP cyclohydrolase I